MKAIQLSIICLLLASPAIAAELKGKVTDAANGEPLTGAIVRISGHPEFGDAAGLDGGYLIRHVPEGSYTIEVSAIGYQSWTRVAQFDAEGSVTINAGLQVTARAIAGVDVISKKDASSERTARGLERDALQVMNIVSGKTIQLSPDLTVANVVQRVSGISLERNSNGDGQFAIVRGMDKRYNYTLVNGVKIPSPDNKYRYVPLDIFPADLLDRLEVYKALTPEMEGDAIGGAINMVMKDAPARRIASINLAGGYNELFTERRFASYDFRGISRESPSDRNAAKYQASAADFSTASTDYRSLNLAPNLLGGFALGNRFLDQRLGVILAGSYQNTNRGANSIFYDIDKVDTFKGATLTKYSRREYSEQQIRAGLHAKADFRIDARNKLQWYNAWMGLSNIQLREVNAMQLTIGGYDWNTGSATLNYSTRTRLTRQNIYNSTLQGEHQLNESLKLNWSAVYSLANQLVPDNTTVPLVGTMKDFVELRTYVGDASRRWEHNSDRDLAGYLNLNYKSHIARTPVLWTLGGMFRDKRRENYYNQYQLRPANAMALYGTDFEQYDEIRWVVQNPEGSVGSSLDYHAMERIAAGFLQFKTTVGKTDVTGGLRAEHTDQGYSLNYPTGADRPEGDQSYLDLLPSLHLKYMPGTKTNLRASYFRSINRPGFFEIVPYKIVNEEYQERGNPDLRHAVADNIDLRYEYYPHQGEQLMVGAFYKRIKDPIEYTLQRDAIRGQDIYYAPDNFGTAHNYGLELDAIKYLRKWGIRANYTYTHSAITTPKAQRIRNSSGSPEIITVDQTRPLYGQSAHVGNISLLFKDVKRGWDVQLAGNYTGERIVTVSEFVDNDLWQKAFTQLDFSLEKSFAGHFSCFVKANNLLNTPLEIYMKQRYNNTAFIPEQLTDGNTLIRRDYYQRSYLLGLRWNL